MSQGQSSKSRSFVKAASRSEAVAKMIRADPILTELYSDGPNKDGKGGWVNMIADQHGGAYRLLFYLDRIRIAPEFSDLEPYEVVFGKIDPDSDEPNFPRAVYTTTGAVNLMRDGIPNATFVRLLKLGQFEIHPCSMEKDLLVTHLRDRGYVAVCIYDKEGEGLRIMDLKDYSEIYFVRERNEIQVRNEHDIEVGDTTDVRPFYLKLAATRGEQVFNNPAEKAASLIKDQ
ncbi:MAG: hypothetical protein R3C05_30990 [Pirellulaceae bacterium]